MYDTSNWVYVDQDPAVYFHITIMAVEMQSLSMRKSISSWRGYVANAVQTNLGQDIKLVDSYKTALYGKWLKNFINDLEFEVYSCSPEPMVIQPCVIDTTNKEFSNLGETETVESVVRAGKNSTIAAGTRYHFLIEEGVSFDHKYDLGAQIVTISMLGGFIKVGESVNKGDQKYNTDLKFHYDHEEKLSIPPKTKVMATITTSTKKFEQAYTLRFRMLRSTGVCLRYLTKRQQKCESFIYCCCCPCCNICKPKVGYLFAGHILRELPNFETDDDYCYFTLDGTLTWISEECSVSMTQSDI